MWKLRTLTALSRNITTKQVKVLNQLYGAICDKQYIRTAQPTATKMQSGEEWPKMNLEVLKSKLKEQNAEQQKDDEKLNDKLKEKLNMTQDIDMETEDWRDPLAVRVHLANPPGDGSFNGSMI